MLQNFCVFFLLLLQDCMCSESCGHQSKKNITLNFPICGHGTYQSLVYERTTNLAPKPYQGGLDI